MCVWVFVCVCVFEYICECVFVCMISEEKEGVVFDLNCRI